MVVVDKVRRDHYVPRSDWNPVRYDIIKNQTSGGYTLRSPQETRAVKDFASLVFAYTNSLMEHPLKMAETTIVDCGDAEKLALESIVTMHNTLVDRTTGSTLPESIPQF